MQVFTQKSPPTLTSFSSKLKPAEVEAKARAQRAKVAAELQQADPQRCAKIRQALAAVGAATPADLPTKTRPADVLGGQIDHDLARKKAAPEIERIR